MACMAKGREKKRKQRAEKKEEQDDQKWTGIKMDAFFETLATVDHADIDLQVRVDTEGYLPIDLEGESRAKTVASMLDDVMGLHWT